MSRLGYDKTTKSLRIAATQNQDLLVNVTGLTPLLTIDVWEVNNAISNFAFKPIFKSMPIILTIKTSDLNMPIKYLALLIGKMLKKDYIVPKIE